MMMQPEIASTTSYIYSIIHILSFEAQKLKALVSYFDWKHDVQTKKVVGICILSVPPILS
jgi:hypothetical protein